MIAQSELNSNVVRYRGDNVVSPLPVSQPVIVHPTPPQISSRLWLLLLAITVHNIPEGLAVGVAFGSEDETASGSAFIRAR